jgi:hypothetical protein
VHSEVLLLVNLVFRRRAAYALHQYRFFADLLTSELAESYFYDGSTPTFLQDGLEIPLLLVGLRVGLISPVIHSQKVGVIGYLLLVVCKEYSPTHNTQQTTLNTTSLSHVMSKSSFPNTVKINLLKYH